MLAHARRGLVDDDDDAGRRESVGESFNRRGGRLVA